MDVDPGAGGAVEYWDEIIEPSRIGEVPCATEPTRRSFPRPLMPLLLFLYSVAKYSSSSLSLWLTLP